MLSAIVFVIVAPKKSKKGGKSEFPALGCKNICTRTQEGTLLMFLNWQGILEVGSTCRGKMSVVG